MQQRTYFIPAIGVLEKPALSIDRQYLQVAAGGMPGSVQSADAVEYLKSPLAGNAPKDVAEWLG
ncbi:hypothetical protein Tdes44962_MAKER09788 [Teratosphaeria destructans]|uniref:Uncharacterized protein n=1 Tax=Teratosphaeria destructans TaxID=418781 RepID=A0A9W7SRN0_9PEZI|nr:hypothetical protein Tdes44962_MAKER09788 [Teratosphaeria destructans]